MLYVNLFSKIYFLNNKKICLKRYTELERPAIRGWWAVLKIDSKPSLDLCRLLAEMANFVRTSSQPPSRGVFLRNVVIFVRVFVGVRARIFFLQQVHHGAGQDEGDGSEGDHDFSDTICEAIVAVIRKDDRKIAKERGLESV